MSTTLEAPTSAPVAPPPVVMTQIITGGLWITKSIYVAAELGIADLVADGPQDVATLAAASGAHAPSLYRVLRALASIGIFAEDEQGRFGLTPLAATLRRDVPGSVRDLARLWGVDWHWAAWNNFIDTVRTGQDSVSLYSGMPLFAFFGEHPDRAQMFEGAMTTFSAQEAGAIAAAYDFSGIGTLTDLGGGHGLLLATILQANPALRGVLFELPFALDGARHLLSEQGLTDRSAVVGGNFFEGVPASDAYILKNILHDFDDAQATAILASCRRSLNPGGRVLVVQEVLPPGNAPSGGKLLDMQMLFIGGKERTETEYRDLLAAAGLRLTRVIPTHSPLHIIEAVAV
jgi:O-methyltransferase domain/Dimerisation domain